MLMLMEARQVAVMMMLMLDVLMIKVMEVKVLVVKEFVVEALLLFSLSSTPNPRTMPQTRPAARVWAWGAKGSGLPIVAPAPGRRCSGSFS